MKAGPGFKYPLENELLFGEKIEINKVTGDWFFCQSLLDGYLGWINIKYLSDVIDVNHRVINLRSNLYEKDNLKANILFHLPLGSKLNVIKETKEWSKIQYYNRNHLCEGFVPNKDIIPINNKVLDWVSIAESLLNTPYKWGGRDSQSVDCSSLIQLSLETIGIYFPRNTKQQIELFKGKNDNIFNRGTLIYWDGHVGVMIDKENFLHANSFHMKVTIEPLIKVKKRAQTLGSKIAKVINFNNFK